jgi:hypothetical protein
VHKDKWSAGTQRTLEIPRCGLCNALRQVAAVPVNTHLNDARDLLVRRQLSALCRARRQGCSAVLGKTLQQCGKERMVDNEACVSAEQAFVLRAVARDRLCKGHRCQVAVCDGAALLCGLFPMQSGARSSLHSEESCPNRLIAQASFANHQHQKARKFWHRNPPSRLGCSGVSNTVFAKGAQGPPCVDRNCCLQEQCALVSSAVLVDVLLLSVCIIACNAHCNIANPICRHLGLSYQTMSRELSHKSNLSRTVSNSYFAVTAVQSVVVLLMRLSQWHDCTGSSAARAHSTVHAVVKTVAAVAVAKRQHDSQAAAVVMISKCNMCVYTDVSCSKCYLAAMHVCNHTQPSIETVAAAAAVMLC